MSAFRLSGIPVANFKIVFVAISVTLGSSIWASDLFGAWALADDTEVSPDEYKESRELGSRWKDAIVVQGVPVPLPTGRSTVGNPDLKPPIITRCEDFTLTRQGDIVRLDCGAVGTYDYRIGEFRGRNVTLKKNKLVEKYSSTNRGVFTQYRLAKNGSMEVKIVLRMGRIKSAYKRIFHPKLDTDTESPDEPAT